MPYAVDGKVARIVIDGSFFWQEEHCRQSYINELIRGHLPGHFHSVNQQGKVNA